MAAWCWPVSYTHLLLGMIAEVPADTTSASHASARWWLRACQSRVVALQLLVERLMPWMLPQYAAVRQQVGEMLYGNVTAGLTLEELPGFTAKLQKKLGEYSFWSEEHGALQELNDRLPECAIGARDIASRCHRVADEADVLVHEMDFRFLFNRKRKMLSVGFDVTQNELVESCYDLLASEARGAVFVACLLYTSRCV